MEIRLTDGTSYELTDCNQTCEPDSNINILNCIMDKQYNFDEISQHLQKPEIAEILTIYDDNNQVMFQTKDYNKGVKVTRDLKTNLITVEFKGKQNNYVD